MLTLFGSLPRHEILNHPPFAQHSPWAWRYDRVPPDDVVRAIAPILAEGRTPVVLRHQLGFAKRWILSTWPRSRFVVMTREIQEWLTSVRHFKNGLYFFYRQRDGSERAAPPDYVGHELSAKWWLAAPWWRRALAHYWAYLGASEEPPGDERILKIHTSNHTTPDDLRRQLEGTWADALCHRAGTFVPSRLRSPRPEYTRRQIRDTFAELNALETAPWRVTPRFALGDTP